MHRELILLVIETVRVGLNLFWQRAKVSECIWSPSNNVLALDSRASILADSILPFCLRSQTLVGSEKAEWIDSDDLALLERGRGDDLQIQVVVVLARLHHLQYYLFVVLESLLVLHDFILNVLLGSYQLRLCNAGSTS